MKAENTAKIPKYGIPGVSQEKIFQIAYTPEIFLIAYTPEKNAT